MARLQAWLAELRTWNRRLNLTAVPEARWWPRHVEEAVRLVEALGIPRGARVVDLGSGAGVPGIPLAVLRGDCRVALVDSDRRRAAFLRHACGVLELGAVEVVAERAEVLGHRPGWREAAEVVVSRATAAPPVLCELALPLLRVGGRLGALVAAADRAAMEAADAAAMCGGGPPSSPAPGLLVVGKLTSTPPGLPRRAGVPRRHPLGSAEPRAARRPAQGFGPQLRRER